MSPYHIPNTITKRIHFSMMHKTSEQKKNTLDKHLSHSFVVFFLFVFALGLVNGSNQPAIQHTEYSPNTFSPAATYGIVRRMDGKQTGKEDF